MWRGLAKPPHAPLPGIRPDRLSPPAGPGDTAPVERFSDTHRLTLAALTSNRSDASRCVAPASTAATTLSRMSSDSAFAMPAGLLAGRKLESDLSRVAEARGDDQALPDTYTPGIPPMAIAKNVVPYWRAETGSRDSAASARERTARDAPPRPRQGKGRPGAGLLRDAEKENYRSESMIYKMAEGVHPDSNRRHCRPRGNWACGAAVGTENATLSGTECTARGGTHVAPRMAKRRRAASWTQGSRPPI